MLRLTLLASKRFSRLIDINGKHLVIIIFHVGIHISLIERTPLIYSPWAGEVRVIDRETHKGALPLFSNFPVQRTSEAVDKERMATLR